MQDLKDLYLELRDPLFKYLYYLCSNADLAEELTQETFYQALISLQGFRGNSTFKTWIFAIARNTYLKAQRKGLKNFHLQIDENTRQDQHREGSEPLHYLLKKEREQVLKKFIRELPENYRTVLVLREFDGWNCQELAQIMGKTANWVRVTHFRARQQLKSKYEQYTGGDDHAD